MTAKAQRAKFENLIVFPKFSYSPRCRACTGKQWAVNVRFGSLADICGGNPLTHAAQPK